MELENTLAWMAWTPPVAIFFSAIVLMLLGMTIWEIRSPTVERKGFLPIATTRGDRLFIGLLSAAYLNLVWAGLTDLDQMIGAALGFLLLLIVMRWG
jgi:predicted small integral membrane protein